MRHFFHRTALTIFLSLAAAPLARQAAADDGYFQIGYGMKSLGMGGTAYALTSSTMTGATNPATASFTPNGFDFSTYVFIQQLNAARQDNIFGLNGSVGSRSKLLVVPEASINAHLDDSLTVGFTLYGNGGLYSAYPADAIPPGRCGLGAPASNLICGQGRFGAVLRQAIFAPTVSYRVSRLVSVAIAPQFAVQQLRISGLQSLDRVSVSPSHLTDRGFDYSYGAGVRLGVYVRLLPSVRVGATYQTQIYSSRFKAYEGLLAEHGRFDIPANLGAGIAWQVTPTLLLACDYERIYYGDVPAVAHSSTFFSPLGSSNGPGFGAHNIDVVKLGVSYDVLPQLTLRAGYNHSGNPIRASNVTFDFLAPGVTEQHVTLGGTYLVSARGQVTVAYIHGFQNHLTGPTSILLPGGGSDTIRLSIDEIGLGYTYAF